MGVVEDLDEEECYLLALMLDRSGIDLAEFLWKDDTTEDGVFRCWDFQVPWYRDESKFQVDMAARCFSADTLVLTRRGQVPINEVEVGDEVLTHRGRWRRVLDVVSRGEQDTVAVRGRGHYGIRCTPDHRFWTASVRRGTNKHDGHRGRVIEDVGFGRASEFAFGHATEKRAVTWWSSPAEFPFGKVPQMEAAYHAGIQNWVDDASAEGFLWLYGLYLAEGSLSSSYGKGGKLNRVTFSVHEDEVEGVCAQLDELGLRYSTVVDAASQKCVNVKVNSEPMATWFMREGHKGAENKQIAPWAYGLEPWQRQAIIDGAVYGDGSTDGRRFQYSTISKALAVSLKLLVQTQGIATSLGHADARQSEIRGEALMTSDQYRVEWSVGQERVRGSFQDGMFWSPVYALEHPDREEVWDLEVEEDHSFVADGVTVHNSVGKTLGIMMRSFSFPFHSPGEEMLLTAPELIHLNPITEKVEERITETRVSNEMLKKKGTSKGITHRPFEAVFVNGARIIGRIPQKDGKGIKGMHPKQLEMDESQDYPDPGWIELSETLKYGNVDSVWRAHGVSRGVRDRFYKQTQPGSGWTVHRVMAMHRPDWTQEERESKAELYGSRDHPDYRRNILGAHGDAQSSLFVLSRLMSCVDSTQSSDYNENEYYSVRVTEEKLQDSGMPIESMIQLPGRHKSYGVTWAGCDFGLTNSPSEILVFGETSESRSSRNPDPETSVLKLLTRIHLQRISAPDQRRVLAHVFEHYRPKAISLDRTGMGLPIYQEIMNDGDKAFQNSIRAFNFSEKIVVGWEYPDEHDPEQWWEEEEPEEVEANVLEWSSDMARLLVDTGRMILPWDVELLREFQGQTYQVSKSSQNPYGRKVFSAGSFHALDATKMAVCGFFYEQIGPMEEVRSEPVMDVFLTG